MRLLHTPAEASNWLREHVRAGLKIDSRQVADGDGFIAWPGSGTDGRNYVDKALAAGASACLVEYSGAEAFGFDDQRVAAYAGLKAATGPIVSTYFGEPSRQLKIAAITGTNGKTSTAWWLAQALENLGRPSAVVGTLGIGRPGSTVPNGLTTPDPVLLQQQLRRLVDEGVVACAVEASSIGIVEHRLDATQIEVAIFTNFTQDHLDYHGSMQAYWEAKKTLFTWSGLKAAVINLDDAKGDELLESSILANGVDVWTFACNAPARLQAQGIEHGAQGMRFDVLEGAQSHHLSTALLGRYNVSNLLAVLATLRAMGIPLQDAVDACANLQSVPGRMETLTAEDCPLVVIDYAHTPDALEQVLQALRPTAQRRNGKLWCVFGCGGNRDALKRPLMAASAQKYADYVMLTSDNPRNESPSAILDAMLTGLRSRESVYVEPDRARAISYVLDVVQPSDVVLIAGKGHEDYQEIKGERLPFSDRAQAQAGLRSYAFRASTGVSA